jgi:hypothetical protein
MTKRAIKCQWFSNVVVCTELMLLVWSTYVLLSPSRSIVPFQNVRECLIMNYVYVIAMTFLSCGFRYNAVIAFSSSFVAFVNIVYFIHMMALISNINANVGIVHIDIADVSKNTSLEYLRLWTQCSSSALDYESALTMTYSSDDRCALCSGIDSMRPVVMYWYCEHVADIVKPMMIIVFVNVSCIVVSLCSMFF